MPTAADPSAIRRLALGGVIGPTVFVGAWLIGSLSTEKPSLKISFDEYIPDQTYGGLDRLTLVRQQMQKAFGLS